MANPNGTQWPIDPALQDPATAGSPSPAPATAAPAGTTAAQPYAQYAHYYQPGAYSHYYMHPQQARPAASTPTPTTAAPIASSSNSHAIDNTDVATLNDALGSAGVDLKAEEDRLQNSSSHTTTYRANEGDRSRKQPNTPSFKTNLLGTTMRSIGANHKVTKVPEDSINYLALALRARLQDLITEMLEASKHRTNAQFDRPASFYDDNTPMWSLVIKKDVRKQLEALEKVEREEESKLRRERKERTEIAAAQMAAFAAAQAEEAKANGEYEDVDGNPKKKRKKEGPGVTAKNMSEDVRMQMSNMVAAQASGIGKKYSWMTAANASGGQSSSKSKTETSAGVAASPPSTASPSIPGRANGTSNGWGKPYVSSTTKPLVPTTATEDDGTIKITLRDAVFVIEKERGHGGGRGAALGWT